MDISIKITGEVEANHAGYSGDMTATISGGGAGGFTISVRVDNAPSREALNDRVFRAVDAYGKSLVAQVSVERALDENQLVPPLSGNL